MCILLLQAASKAAEAADSAGPPELVAAEK